MKVVKHLVCGLIGDVHDSGVKTNMAHINCRWHQRASFSEVMSAHSGLKQRLSTVNHIAIALCTMIDANPVPEGIVCSSVLAALFLFRAMLMTHAGGYGKVRTLWICTLFAITMQMTIPIAMFHRFSLASFMQAVRINHDYVWCFDYVGFVECLEDEGCGCEET
jgi:hypothetical protein